MKFYYLLAFATFYSALYSAELENKFLIEKSLHEISGMSYSPRINAFYAVNDSGNGSEIFILSTSGIIQDKFQVKGVSFRDVEALFYGPCVGEKERFCLFLSDSGNNSLKKNNIHIYEVSELSLLKARSENNKVLLIKNKYTFFYPYRLHDVEAFFQDSNSSFIFLTKEDQSEEQGVEGPIVGDGKDSVVKRALKKRYGVSHVYRGVVNNKTLSYEGFLDFKKLFGKQDEFSYLPTDMALDFQSKEGLILTYAKIYKISKQNGKFFKRENESKNTVESLSLQVYQGQVIQIKPLFQQEAISYLSNQSFSVANENNFLSRSYLQNFRF